MTTGEKSLVSDLILDFIHYRITSNNANYDIVIKTLINMFSESDKQEVYEKIENRFGTKIAR